ncbi:hypothetical protein SynSYN20_02958 [Synechococcus sp. SYN20]|nr:hypothetical protein SynSYN20_02958 [Synechococcus sp. SYN20]
MVTADLRHKESLHSPHRRTSLCIGRNQAAAATSEQFGEIAHWGESHSFKRMSQGIKKEGD